MKISVTRALTELKTLDSRIHKAILEASFVATYIGEGAVKGFVSNEAFKDKAVSSRDSITALISRRAAIKAAIVQSNAATEVTVGAVKMTVAEAIELKSSITYKRDFLHQLKSQFSRAHNMMETANQQLETSVDGQVDKLLGSAAKKDPDTTAKLRESLLAGRNTKVLDPLNVSDLITALESEIENFDQNINVALSEINARTEIEVPEQAAAVA